MSAELDAAFAEAQRWVESPITSPDLSPSVVNALVATIERQGRQLDAARARLGDAVAELSAIRQDLDAARAENAEQAAEIERLRAAIREHIENPSVPLAAPAVRTLRAALDAAPAATRE